MLTVAHRRQYAGLKVAPVIVVTIGFRLRLGVAAATVVVGRSWGWSRRHVRVGPYVMAR